MPHNPGKLAFTTVTGIGDGFEWSPTESQRKPHDHDSSTQHQASDDNSDQLQDGDMLVDDMAVQKSTPLDSTAISPQSFNQDATKLNEVTEVNCIPSASH